MRKILVLGAGKIGALISGLLAESGDYAVALADVDGNASAAVAKAHGSERLTAHAVDATQRKSLDAFLATHKIDAVVSSLPYYCNPVVAAAARKADAHYFDLTEDVTVTRAVRRIARGAKRAMPLPVSVPSPPISAAAVTAVLFTVFSHPCKV